MPDCSFVRMEKAVMQSCWIQRLNPTRDTTALEDEETEPDPVWTHFTKDFSSCSKRLHKARNHTRSSSWPPNERTTSCAPSLHLKLGKPADLQEPFPLARACLPTFRDERSRVSLQDGPESNCFKAGNLFSSQKSSRKSGEALAPSSHAVRTSDEFHAGKRCGESKFRSSAAQQSYSKFNLESGSLLELTSARVLGDAPCKEKLPVSESVHKMPHARGSSPDGVIGTFLSPALMGASADADDRTLLSHPLIRSVHLPTQSLLSVNRPAVVFGSTESKVNKIQLEMMFSKHPGKVCGKEVKNRQNFGFLHVAGQSIKPNSLGANPSMGRGGSGSHRCSDKVGARDLDAGLFTDSKPNEEKYNVGFGNFATNAGSFVSKELHDVDSFNKDLRRCDPVIAERLCNPMEEVATKMPWARLPSGGFTRVSSRETSFDECRAHFFEDSRSAKLFDTSYCEDIQHQKHITDGCYRFSSTESRGKLDENEKHNSSQNPGARIPFNSRAQIHTSRDVPSRTQVPSRSSSFYIKQMGLGHNPCTSANKSLLEESSVLRTWQEEILRGGMSRVGPKSCKKESVCDNGRMVESSRNEAWIQRWQSSSNLVLMSKNTLFTSFGMDKEKGTPPEKPGASTNPKEVRNEDWVDCNLLEPPRASKLHIDDSGLGTSRGSFPVYESYAKSKFLASSVEAMAIVSNTTGKLHITSLENRGSFSVWPCPSEEDHQGERLGEPRETVEDNMHEVEMDGLESLGHKWR